MNKTADYVIVGGGVIGCSIAYNLAKKGAKNIVLIEKGYLASGATGRCGAGVRMQFGTETNCLLAKHSIEMFEHLEEELEYPDSIEFKQGGYLLLAYTEKMVEQFHKNLGVQHRLGIPSRWVTPEEAKEIVPHLNTQGLLGATFCGKDGHCNPFKTTDAYAKAAKRLGVEIMTYTEVSRLLERDGKIIGVETGGGIIETPVVVLCAGAHSRELAATVGVDLPITPERHQILVTEPVEMMQGPMVMSFYHGLYCQQVPHGSFIMGLGDPNEPKEYNQQGSWQFLHEMAAKATFILPPLANLRVVRQWAGLYDLTPDRQQILGSVPGLQGFHLAAGFSGHGFMIAPMTGKLMAEHILGEPTGFPISMFDFTRFERGELYVEPSVV
ncbi:NAD(P)/FAD-dependent oxidoreductase [Desulforamulus hydrothermalis]|uniref:FAD dependent oxidoreductase n=1 Tax=Desulforamulus hydrothermalis Lam5 = DSM 18033 TaxID=1121428 RepID=K8DXD4_9FIRM|nr:FAD-binding oxidoreductase [Desulforamulus hydrothermalis]CCO07155.1 FAD dependent oxidoreductase [Desulforamulus hydrothermalis Lam5 = DSM 18033]SHG88888.1 sarcosine oxidase subunit beta [Desulforamulus hydrothermalis Lam5 = DSM 18033]